MNNIEPSGPTLLNECMDLYMDYLKSEDKTLSVNDSKYDDRKEM